MAKGASGVVAHILSEKGHHTPDQEADSRECLCSAHLIYTEQYHRPGDDATHSGQALLSQLTGSS